MIYSNNPLSFLCKYIFYSVLLEIEKQMEHGGARDVYEEMKPYPEDFFKDFGVTVQEANLLYSLLKPYMRNARAQAFLAHHRCRGPIVQLSGMNRLLLTLYDYRKGHSEELVGRRFGVNEAFVSRDSLRISYCYSLGSLFSRYDYVD